MQSRSAWVLARDGTRLATDVHLPDAPRAEAALTFLLRTPYGRRGTFDAVPELAAYLTGLGHVLVSQDVRGKFDSEGRCRPFAQEPSDGADTVTWAASQSWSTGRIVTTGESYCGFTALTAAACGHPSVAAVFAGMTTSRVASRWLDCGGAFRLQLNVEWITLSFGQKALPELPWTIEDWWHDDVEDVDTHDADLTTLRELRLASLGESGDRELAGGLTVPAAEAARVPIVLWGGYWDPLVRGTIEEFRAACAAPATPEAPSRAPQRGPPEQPLAGRDRRKDDAAGEGPVARAVLRAQPAAPGPRRVVRGKDRDRWRPGRLRRPARTPVHLGGLAADLGTRDDRHVRG